MISAAASSKKPEHKALVWMVDEVTAPPFTADAKEEAFDLLEKLCAGEMLSLPASRPMPAIGKRCHELRIKDENCIWRIFYRIDTDAIIIAEVLKKKTEKTPLQTINTCKKRYK